MKVGLIYTSTTPELIQMVESSIKKKLGEKVELLSYQDPSILSDTIEAGHVTKEAGMKLMGLYTRAIEAGADVLFNLCSSVGEVADAIKPYMESIEVPLVRIDEDMCKQAVLAGRRIGVMATLATTLEPTKHTLQNFAMACDKEIILVDGLLEGAFGLSQDAFKERMLDMANSLKDKVDILLFAQGSMAYCHDYIENEIGIPVFSSIRYGTNHLETTILDMEIKKKIKNLSKKIIVLDDDPTGIQTVHDVYVYTDWEIDTIEAIFNDSNVMAYILTNSRGLTQSESMAIHKSIAKNIETVSNRTNNDYLIISRSDSTLRGHYPMETQILKESIESTSNVVFDGEIFCPFFHEGGRLTKNGIHYIVNGDQWTPVSETEFAKDKTFPFSHAFLPDYIEEKSNGAYKARNCSLITFDQLIYENVDSITGKLMEIEGFNKVIVDGVDYKHLKVFALAFMDVLGEGKHFMIRSAAGLPKILGGITDQELLNHKQLIDGNSKNGGLVVVGSHVSKSTKQLEYLKDSRQDLTYLEIDVNKLIDDNRALDHIHNNIRNIDNLIKDGQSVVVYTSRGLVASSIDKEKSLNLSIKVANGITAIVAGLKESPKFIIAKGGITSSEIGTKALGVKRAKVIGQVLPGIPVWETGQESKFPGLPYIIFPGNVGTCKDLATIVNKLD